MNSVDRLAANRQEVKLIVVLLYNGYYDEQPTSIRAACVNLKLCIELLNFD